MNFFGCVALHADHAQFGMFENRRFVYAVKFVLQLCVPYVTGPDVYLIDKHPGGDQNKLKSQRLIVLARRYGDFVA